MDYKYIEQLLDRYFECHTSLEEEQILRSFFSQKAVPEHLKQFAELFRFEKQAQQVTLSDDFDQRMMALIEADEAAEGNRVKARVVSLKSRMAPLWKAAAVVAVVFTVGTATEHALTDSESQQTTGAPVVADTYVRSADVASVVSPAEKLKEATAAVQTDTLSLTN